MSYMVLEEEHMLQYTCGGQTTAVPSLSPSTFTWVLGIQLWSRGLASTFTCGAILLLRKLKILMFEIQERLSMLMSYQHRVISVGSGNGEAVWCKGKLT